jgi:hypothetical protein
MAVVTAMQSDRAANQKSYCELQETIFHIMHVVFHRTQLFFITIKFTVLLSFQVAEEQHGQQGL